MHPKTLTIVYNPKGGSASRNTVNELAGHFVSRDIKVEFLATTAEPGSATKLAAQAAASGAKLVVAFGGDGTACQVAEGLRGSGVPMAIYPGGTGNLFAKAYYSPPTPDSFVEMVLNGKPQAVDMVRVDYADLAGKPQNRYFMVGFGLGKMSDAISSASPVFKQIFGRLVYVLKVSLACLWPNSRRFRLVEPDSDSSEEAAAVLALNVAPPMLTTISRGCNASDGLIDVVVLRCTNILHLMGVALCLAFGKLERSKRYRRFRTNKLTIKCNKAMLPNIDGDPGVLTKEIRLTVDPGAVRIILS